MLGFIITDAAIESKPLKACLAEAVANSFNRITVDGDMSTNDTVFVLANGMAGNAELKNKSEHNIKLHSLLERIANLQKLNSIKLF